VRWVAASARTRVWFFVREIRDDEHSEEARADVSDVELSISNDRADLKGKVSLS